MFSGFLAVDDDDLREILAALGFCWVQGISWVGVPMRLAWGPDGDERARGLTETVPAPGRAGQRSWPGQDHPTQSYPDARASSAQRHHAW